MCKIQTLLSLSIGVLSLASVRGQNFTHQFCEDGIELTNVTANCSGSCVLFGEYEDLPVNDRVFTPVCNTQGLVRRRKLQFPFNDTLEANCQIKLPVDNFCDRLEFNDSHLYILIEANSSNLLLESGERVCHLNCENKSTSHCVVFKWNGTEDMSGSGFGMTSSCFLEPQMSSTTLVPTSTVFSTSMMTKSNSPEATNGPTSNTDPEMNFLYIAIGGGAAGGFLILVIILLLAVVCCLSAKIMKSKRQMQLKLPDEEHPDNAMNNPTYTAERHPAASVQINVFSPYQTVGSPPEDAYDSIETKTGANKQFSRSRSNSKEDKCGNYSYVASNTCKKRPVIHEASSSLHIPTEFDGYSEIAEQQTPYPYESVIREDSFGHLSPPTIVKMPMTNDTYSYLSHPLTDRSLNRFSAPLPLPSEEYSKLNVRTLEHRRSDYYNIELTNLPSDSQQAQVFENEYSLLQDVSVPGRHKLDPPLPSFTQETTKPSEYNNGVKSYNKEDSAQNTQLGKTSQLLHDGAMPVEDEELLQDLQVVKV